jgi:uncharacterized membrane protein SirB2
MASRASDARHPCRTSITDLLAAAPQLASMFEHYSTIRSVHVTAVILSGCLFAWRGGMTLLGSRLPRHPALRVLSVAIDITLLAAAVTLSMLSRQYPLMDGWLSAKLVLLIIYILLGWQVLQGNHHPRRRACCYLGALATYLFIISIASTRHPLGFLMF